jgi:excisionase family DNA binding protein
VAEYLKLPDVARRLDVSEKTARRYVKSGELPSVFIGGAYRVSEVDLEAFLSRARVTPGGGYPKEERSSSREPSLWNGLEEERRTEADKYEHLEDLAEVDSGWLSEFLHGAEMRRVCVELLDDGSVELRGYRA